MTSIVHLVTLHLLFIWSHDIYCSSGHMTSIVHLFFCPSWRGILLCSLLKGSYQKLFSVLKELFLMQCEVKGQGCGMSTDCKALRIISILGYQAILRKLNGVEQKEGSFLQLHNTIILFPRWLEVLMGSEPGLTLA